LGGHLARCPENSVPAEIAMRADLAGMRIFDAPIAGCCAADDPCLLSFSREEVAGLAMSPPAEWLPSARSVVSVFFPFVPQIRQSDRGGADPSLEWLHGRIEGQACIEKTGLFLAEALRGRADDGSIHEALVPILDGRFAVTKDASCDGGRAFRSNWSERHAAFAAGLGTFSLNGGLITRLGMAGRIISVVTSVEIEPTPRAYTEAGEYCVMCGACARNCPAGAIRAVGGKDHLRCSDWLEDVRARFSPYYGCGKCQTGVPCETRIPARGAV